MQASVTVLIDGSKKGNQTVKLLGRCPLDEKPLSETKVPGTVHNSDTEQRLNGLLRVG